MYIDELKLNQSFFGIARRVVVGWEGRWARGDGMGMGGLGDIRLSVGLVVAYWWRGI